MSIFNSLGSNYDFTYVLKSLLPPASKELKTLLDDKYQGSTTLVYKGRQALELGLHALKLPAGSKVAINGFTCFAVYQAVINAGLEVKYVDINPATLNFEASQLTSDIKAVIIQNTLGYPCDMEKIAHFCQKNNIPLIEDLAHCIGCIYADGREAGSVGDMVVLSFSQDKVVDGVSGGALVMRNKKYQLETTVFHTPSLRQQLIDKLYPLFTYLIRTTYAIGLGKVLHALLKKAHLLSQPMGEKGSRMLTLPDWYCQLIVDEFAQSEAQLKHRRQIASIYAETVDSGCLSEKIVDAVPQATNLRFPLFVKNREKVINALKNQGVYISDIWYDAPIAPKKYLSMTNYSGQCPEAEKVSATILNLPTHINITATKARQIAEEVNKWQK